MMLALRRVKCQPPCIVLVVLPAQLPCQPAASQSSLPASLPAVSCLPDVFFCLACTMCDFLPAPHPPKSAMNANCTTLLAVAHAQHRPGMCCQLPASVSRTCPPFPLMCLELPTVVTTMPHNKAHQAGQQIKSTEKERSDENRRRGWGKTCAYVEAGISRQECSRQGV